MRLWPRTVRVQGSLLGRERAIVGAKVAGRVKEIPVDLGSVVRAGEVMARLEPEEFDLKVQQAEGRVEEIRAALGLAPGDDEAKLDPQKTPAVLEEQALRVQAQADWERAEILARREAASAEELQQRKAALGVAEARCQSALQSVGESIASLGVRRVELALARQARADSEIRVPFDGIVEQRHVAPGAYVQVGQPIVSVVSMDPLRFHAGVPEREAMRLQLGQAVHVMIEGEKAPLVGKITRISPSLDLTSRSLTIEADLPNPGLRLRTGLFAEADIVVDPAAETLAAPLRAVREFAGVEKVRVVRDGKAAEQAVQTGRRDKEWIEVTEGLKAGDRVEVPAGTRGR
jgi:RND family efflux transporter MFP subunit